ncbi:aromatic ring-hydroxylating oxygenase subunit alpha [Dermatobacter hominis]|uniref:aromatic ring-hydroxylating oxygenase subunit alpha n=1 Tax=Dermatobacter hominis TaxID=2884263 RepID=UPI001D12383E|nr:aromatic ring-hydroxylating dioxygenase subunit alpha [Dermatobacter hominis]UDY35481.1 aromatic ring-hydroxylating dioxygenase subunit alpha [Dermatobacter hominis]
MANDDPRLRRYWHVACRAAALDDGPVAATVLGEELVIARLDDGTVTALPDRCPHRWARLSDGCVRGAEIECPYHGWRFDGAGRCTAVPALGEDAAVPSRAHLEPVRTTEALGLVWVALDEPAAPLLEVPEWDADGVVAVWLPDTDLSAGCAQFVDNFLDIAHFPFVHRGTFGLEDQPETEPFAVEDTDGGAGLRVRYRHEVANPEDPAVATGEHPLVQFRSMEYTWRVPFSARLRLEYELTGVENTILVFVTPVDATSSRLFCVLLRNDVTSPEDPRARSAAEFEYRVLTEDLVLLERLAERDFGLAVTEQVHTRADRNTIELRRLLGAHLEGLDGAAPGALDAHTVPSLLEATP